jgi:hypothetical protein
MAHNEEVNAGAGALKRPQGTCVYWILCAVFIIVRPVKQKKLQMKEKVQGIFYLAGN